MPERKPSRPKRISARRGLDHRLKAQEIEQLMDDLKDAVKKDVPEVQHIQVEVETPRRRAMRKHE